MNLPHQAPLIFAKKIILIENNKAIILCEFEEIPTLSMFIEASAQASSAFNIEKEKKAKIGFLTVVKNIEQIGDIVNNKFLITVIKENEINNIKQFSFEVSDQKTTSHVLVGTFTILVQDNDK